jgi:electron transport complex protein RnfA
VVFGLSAGVGFTIALILFSGIREKMEFCDIPVAFKGLPITLIAAALVSVAFFGFKGLFGI